MNDTEICQSEDFGAYALKGVHKSLLSMAQAQPKNWVGRRVALALRKIILKTYRGHLIDSTLDGLKIRFHTKDNVSERKYLFTPQFFDVFERDLIAKKLPKDGVFVDIGANAGLYTLTAAKHLGDKGRTISVEPNPVVRQRLEQNLKFNNFPAKVATIPCGVSDSNGSFTLYIDKTNLGGSSLHAGRDNQGEGIEIPCRTLADILDESKISKIDILKIDIEGAEEQALRPFFEMADQDLWPDHMIIENDAKQWESGLIDWLIDKERGYALIKTTRMNIVLSRA
jgi:FkbM family methyltransferase